MSSPFFQAERKMQTIKKLFFCYNKAMSKKTVIFVLVCIVCTLALSYHTALIKDRGENLIADAYYGDLVSVKDDVQEGAPLDFTLYFSDEEREYTNMEFNALHAAASGGNEDVINYLLDLGFDINGKTPNKWTPLFIAARDGNSEAAKLLIFRGADLNTQTDLGATPLLMAVTQKYPTEKARTDLITYMLKRGANPNLATQSGYNALFYAAATHRLPVVQLLLENEAELSTERYQEVTTLLKKTNTDTDKKITALLKKAVKHK